MLFTFPSRYWFTIGQRVVFSLGRWSSRIPTRFHVPGGTRGHPRVNHDFGYGAITHYGRTFHSVCLPIINPMSGPHNPRSIEMGQVWATPRSLAATDGITFVFFSCGYLDVSVPRVRHVWLCIHHTLLEHYLQWVSPFGNLRVKACLAAHRSLSQLTTSFIASLCLGIHRTPLIA